MNLPTPFADRKTLPHRQSRGILLAAEATLIFGLAIAWLGWNLEAERHFVDESAYVSQSFFADLYLRGAWDHPSWLTYAGYDLPPLPKYLIGWSLASSGMPRPGMDDARAWYANTSRQFLDPQGLAVARRPMVACGALGVVFAWALGRTIGGPWAGRLAALFLLANPLYSMHARRAMSDVPEECFMLGCLAASLHAVDRLARGRPIVAATWLGLVGGLMLGLATLSKLSGALAGFVLIGWFVLACGLPTLSGRRKLMLGGMMATAAVVGLATFALLNPFLWARPGISLAPEARAVADLGVFGRARLLSDHRIGVSREALRIFPDDALANLVDKAEVVAVQGFGRFGLLGIRGWTDSTRRFDWAQDRGALVWLPVVLVGFASAIRSGWSSLHAGDVPRGWFLAAQALVVLVVVTGFIPLAWDRYLLPIQPTACLLAATGVAEVARACFNRRGRS